MAGGPQFIQGVSGTTEIHATKVTGPFVTQNTAAGSMLCAVFNVSPTTAAITAITDSQGGNTWNVISIGSPGTSYNTYFCYALNTTGGSKPTLTITTTGSPADIWWCLGEYSGVNTLRGSSTYTTASTGTSFTTSAATSIANDLILSAFGSNANLSSAPTGTTEREAGGNGTVFLPAFGDFSASSTSSTFAWTKQSNVLVGGVALAFFGSYSIAGSTGVAGTTVGYVGTNLGVSGSVTSTTGGAYSITGLPADVYTITPTQTGYTFSPTSASETITSANISGVNFTGSSTGGGNGNLGLLKLLGVN